MLNFNSQDLQTFLIQAQLANQKVKALAQNKLSPEQFDRLQGLRAEDKRKRQQAMKRKERQTFQKKKQGREGKGITKDFMNFCRFCHREYQLPTPLCAKCNRNTMTLKQRQQQLQLMVNDYKDKKKRRQQRKMKWDMWQKTKAMLWKKTSNNYDKWQYFVSDSEQQPQKQPIVPKNDPNFMALQRDMQQRKAQRQKDTKKAKQLKDKGNVFMKAGNYQQAKNMYSLALQHIKDMKSIYTNRALAYIKLGKFKKAIKDCTNVIQYIQLFEKSQQCKDTIFKAYLRRSLAKKQLKQYKQAQQDVNKALTFAPGDKSAELLKKQIQGFIKYSENVEKMLRENRKIQIQEREAEKTNQNEGKNQNNQKADEEDQKLLNQQQSQLQQNQIIKQLAQAQLKEQNSQNNIKQQQKQQIQKKDQKQRENKRLSKQEQQKNYQNPVQQIKQRLQNLNEQNITGIFKLLKQKPDLVNIFIAAKSISKCLNQLVTTEQCKKQGFLVSICLRGDGVGEKEVWDFGIPKIYKRINEFLDNSTDINMSRYFILQDIFQVLIPMSLHQKYRIILSQSPQTHKFLEKIFSQLLTRHKKQPDLFSSVLIFMGNLCSGSSKLRENFINQQKFKTIVNSLYEKVISRKTVNRSYLALKKNSYSLFANLIINQKYRIKLIQLFQEKQLGQDQATRWDELVKELKYFPRSNQIFQQYILSLLSVFANVTLGTNSKISGLSNCINQRFLTNPSSFAPQIIYRALLIVSRLKYENTTIFSQYLKNFSAHLHTFKKKSEKNSMQQIVRILNIMYSPIQGQPKFSEALPKNIQHQLQSYIKSIENGESLFCNTCNLFGVILDSKIQYSNRLYQNLRPHIKFLIQVAKQKIGNWRKNASILLAKLSLNPDCKEELYKHHGMEVLKSIAQFVKEK